MNTRASIIALVACTAAGTALTAERSAQAAPDVLILPSLAASVAQIPMMARLADLLDGCHLEVPQVVADELGQWREGLQMRLDTALQGLSERLLAFTAQTAPNLRPITTEPIASSHFSEESSGYGWRNDPINHHPKFHGGTDFRGHLGTPVLAAGAGTVAFAGQMNGYGNLVIVDHGNGLSTRYGHLRRIVTTKGATLAAGTEVGELGRTGRATGPHLHFEVRLGGRPVDPIAALSVAQLQRESSVRGDLAAQALAPDLQRQLASSIDPPKSGAHATGQRSGVSPASARSTESRPDRAGHVKRVKPLS